MRVGGRVGGSLVGSRPGLWVRVNRVEFDVVGI